MICRKLGFDLRIYALDFMDASALGRLELYH
jgi:hypothetical protein